MMIDMRYLVRALLIPIVVLVAIATILELGLYLRSKVEPTLSAPIGSNGEERVTRVLLIGDSILGFLGLPETVAGRILTLSQSSGVQRNGVRYEFDEISKTAQLTSEALSALPSRLKTFRPDIVVMMVGKSDFAAGPATLPNWVLNLRISKLFLVAMSDMGLRWRGLAATPQLKSSHDLAFDPAWSLYGERRYKDAIPLFENALRAHPHYETGIRGLYHCYLQGENYQSGALFFRELSTHSRKRDLLRILADSLDLQVKKSSVAEREILLNRLNSTLRESKDQRAALKAELWLLKQRDLRSKEFAAKLSQMTVSQSSTILPKTLENLKRVFAMIGDSGARTVFVQYPTDHASALTEPLGPVGPHVTIVDSKTWLLGENAPQLVDDDIEHVTPEGADVLAHEIVHLLGTYESR